MTRRIRFPLALALLVSASGCISFDPASTRQLDEADRLERAASLNPSNAHAWFATGKQRLDAGDFDGAQEAFQSALAAQPEFDEAELGLALSHLEQREFAAARRAYTALAERRPDLAAAWEGLAATELEARRPDAAEAAAREALRCDGRSAPALRVLGEAAYIRGDHRAAVRAWSAAIDADPALEPRLGPLLADLRLYLRKYAPGADMGSDTAANAPATERPR
ncbi:MAG: tetratricopeptide repeat protein [Candidatus Sumerlaeia bacterium]|nr:tetratricopeptide repeat protein [Candidatus Sumerlaeia bacterium]